MASSRRAQASPVPNDRTSLPIGAFQTGKQPLASAKAGTEEHLLQSFLSPQVSSILCKHICQSVWDSSQQLHNTCCQLCVLCSLHSPIPVYINGSRAMERLPAADCRSKSAVKLTASQHSALHTSHLVQVLCLVLYIIVLKMLLLNPDYTFSS